MTDSTRRSKWERATAAAHSIGQQTTPSFRFGVKGRPSKYQVRVMKRREGSGRKLEPKARPDTAESRPDNIQAKARRAQDVKEKALRHTDAHMSKSAGVSSIQTDAYRAMKNQDWMARKTGPNWSEPEEKHPSGSLENPKTLGYRANKIKDTGRAGNSGGRVIKKSLPKTEATTMSLADRILGEAKKPSMARYKSLKAKVCNAKMSEGTSLLDRVLGEGKKATKDWGHSDFQTKIKSKKPWGASTFQTKVHSEGKDDLFGLVDSLVELRNSIIK